MLAIAFAAAMLVAPSAQAAPPPSAAATNAPSARAMALVNLMHLEPQLDSTYAGIAPLVGTQMVSGLESSPVTSSYVAGIIAKLPGGRARLAQIAGEEFRREVRTVYPDLKAAMAEGFDANFTPAEIDELIRFFSTGTGAKYLASQGAIQLELQKAAQNVGQRVAGLAQTATLHRAEAEAGSAPAQPSGH